MKTLYNSNRESKLEKRGRIKKQKDFKPKVKKKMFHVEQNDGGN